MNYQAVEETIRAGYRTATAQYRRDDEIEVTTPNHARICSTLRRLCASFPARISALDVGCGTGRYFHCLSNVEHLVGMDISEEMLQEAAHPVRGEEVSIPRVTLRRANAYLTDFPPGSFHLIYSLGMFGNGCAVTVELCDKFHDWLAPGGCLYFNVVDLAGLPLWYRSRRRARKILYPLLTRGLQSLLDRRAARHPFCGLGRRELIQILNATKFRDFTVTSHVCESPLWRGRHLDCIARKL